MFSKSSMLRRASGLGLILTILAGCAAHRVNLLEAGNVAVELVPCRGVCAAEVQVYQEGEEMVVSGRVKRSHLGTAVGAGYVRIQVIGPDGKVLKQVETGYSPRIVKRKGIRESTFTARIPTLPPKGSVIRVSYEGG